MEQEKMITKTYTKKNGDIVVKQYNQQTYNKKYYSVHKDILNIKTLCGCGGKFSITNQNKHEKSRLHLLYEKFNPVLIGNVI